MLQYFGRKLSFNPGMLKHAPIWRGWYFPNACPEKSVMHPHISDNCTW